MSQVYDLHFFQGSTVFLGSKRVPSKCTMICVQHIILDVWIMNVRIGILGKTFLTNLEKSHLKKTAGTLRRVLKKQIFSCPSHSSSGSGWSSPVSVPAGGPSVSPPSHPWLCCGTPQRCSFSNRPALSASPPEPPPCVYSEPQSTTPSRRHQGSFPGSWAKAAPGTMSPLGALG